MVRLVLEAVADVIEDTLFDRTEKLDHYKTLRQILGWAAQGHWNRGRFGCLAHEKSVIDRQLLDAVAAADFVDRLAIGNTAAMLLDELDSGPNLESPRCRILDTGSDHSGHKLTADTLVNIPGLGCYELEVRTWSR